MTIPRSGDKRIAYVCLALRLADTLLVSLNQTPLLRLLEGNVCRNYYRLHDPSVIGSDGNVLEERCKTMQIQGEVSHISGLFTLFWVIPSVLAALPYLLQKDIRNKRRILLINACGSTMANAYHMSILYFYNVFDPRWIWLDGLFSFIGGGDLVYFAMLQALIAESVEHTVLSSYYIYSSAVSLILKVLGSASSLSIMKFSVWLPVIISIGLKALVILFMFPLLGSLGRTGTYTRLNDNETLATNHSNLPDVAEEPSSIDGPLEKQSSMWESLTEQRITFLKYIFPLTVFALYEIGDSIKVILPYWISKRYNWTLRAGGWVQLGITLLNAVIVSLLPKLSTWLQNRRGSNDSKARDLNLAKMCLASYTIGAGLLGFSWHGGSAVISLAVMAGGTAFRDAYLGYITADMQKEDISQVYIVLSLVSIASYSLGGWVIADVYALCLTLGDNWETSVPVWTCALGFATCWYLLR